MRVSARLGRRCNCSHRAALLRSREESHTMQRDHPRRRPFVAEITAVTLAALGALHVAWGRGSTFPFPTRHDLNDAVIGRQAAPSAPSCYGVAAALTVAAVSINRASHRHDAWARFAAAGVAIVLTTRAVLGFAGRTDLAVPGSTSNRFRRLDRRLYSPLCLGLAAGAAHAARSGRSVG